MGSSCKRPSNMSGQMFQVNADMGTNSSIVDVKSKRYRRISELDQCNVSSTQPYIKKKRGRPRKSVVADDSNVHCENVPFVGPISQKYGHQIASQNLNDRHQIYIPSNNAIDSTQKCKTAVSNQTQHGEFVYTPHDTANMHVCSATHNHTEVHIGGFHSANDGGGILLPGQNVTPVRNMRRSHRAVFFDNPAPVLGHYAAQRMLQDLCTNMIGQMIAQTIGPRSLHK